jgi:manganese/iron transport system permease protein
VSLLLEPFARPFMRSALLAAVLVGLTCALLGVYVVRRRMAFVGDALAHTTLPGLAVAYLFGWNLSAGALAAGVTTAVLVGWAGRKRAVSEDTALGVVFTGLFALGVLLLTRGGTQRDLAHALVGNLLGVSAGDLWLMAGVLAAVAVAAGLSVASTVGGLVLSYHVPRTPTGAAVVLVATGLLAAVAACRSAVGTSERQRKTFT